MPVYISGPMSGMPSHNFPEFNRVATALRAKGMAVVNPAELNAERPSRAVAIRRDIEGLLTCTAIVTIEGWQNSQGARLEVAIAEELGLIHRPAWIAISWPKWGLPPAMFVGGTRT